MLCDSCSDRLRDEVLTKSTALGRNSTTLPLCAQEPLVVISCQLLTWHQSCAISPPPALFPLPSTRLSHTWLLLCFLTPSCLWQPPPTPVPCTLSGPWQFLWVWRPSKSANLTYSLFHLPASGCLTCRASQFQNPGEGLFWAQLPVPWLVF